MIVTPLCTSFELVSSTDLLLRFSPFLSIWTGLHMCINRADSIFKGGIWAFRTQAGYI